MTIIFSFNLYSLITWHILVIGLNSQYNNILLYFTILEEYAITLLVYIIIIRIFKFFLFLMIFIYMVYIFEIIIIFRIISI